MRGAHREGVIAFLAAAAPIIGAVGAGVSAIGSITGGMAQGAEANYQAQVARNNQIISEQNAQYATQAGEARAYDVGLRERDTAGKIRTGIAANNIDVNTGSARDVQVGQAEKGQLDVERTAAEGALTAYGYRTQATSFGAQAQLLQAEAPMDVMGGFLKAGGNLLSGASNIGFGLNRTSAAIPGSDLPIG